MGHIMTLLSEEEDKETPLQKQVTSISKKFMKGALMIGGIVFIAGLIRGVPMTQLVTTSMALTASAIPEGLPVTITIALTAGIFRMAKKNSLIRKLSALETLGRATVICSDKTGTLTKNEMTVMRVATIVEQFKVSGDGYKPEGKIIDLHGVESESKDLEKLLKIGLLCSNTTLEKIDNQWSIKGDPTEGAIVTLAAKRGINKENHEDWKRLHEIPFDSSSGKMTVVCKNENLEKQCFVMSKGSVEKILVHCTHFQKKGRRYPLTQEIKTLILNQNEEFAKQSLRVIAFAYRPIKPDHCMEDIEDQLTYVGMVGMIDPPKVDVKKSILEAQRLGIKPIMITGDHPITALAIAKKVGICDGSKKVITGHDLENMNDEELSCKIDDVAVFSRVTPEHKLRIVTILQDKGHIVAMTGDGVNDSPAIKKAQIGIAMGQTGTQVTKEIADIVLKEDHFGSIVEGVKEGRTIISNIRKALGCLLSGNLAEIIVTSSSVIAGLPLPVIPIQILLMNLLTDALPAMVLAINPGNKSNQTERQEIADKSLYKQVITRGCILGIGALGLFAATLASGASLAVAQTTAFATLVAGQLIQTFSWRQQGTSQNVKDWSKDKFLVGALGASWLSLIATIYIPGLGGIFKTTTLPLLSWLPIIGVASCSAIITKYILKIQAVKPRSLTVQHQGLFAA
jgi:magnesium-transporting ATPase (P-type)